MRKKIVYANVEVDFQFQNLLIGRIFSNNFREEIIRKLEELTEQILKDIAEGVLPISQVQ